LSGRRHDRNGSVAGPQPNAPPGMRDEGLRVLVVDDEPLARAGLRAILRDERDVEIVGESGTGADAVAAIEALAPDLVFLDIALPDIDGFDIVERIPRDRRPALVFVTAHSDQALRAFEARALDYVTKPIRRDRVREAVARARERIRLERLDRAGSEVLHPSGAAAVAGPLALKIDGRVQLIDPSTIDWVAADDDHILVHTADRTWRARETLRDVARRLDPARFIRIHRSTIVRLGAVRELQPWFHGDYIVLLHQGAKLRLSRGYRDGVARMLGREI
jgi:two-component system LytT family response regulator